MSSPETEALPVPPAAQPAGQHDYAADLTDLVSGLRQAFPRLVHGARLDQIESVASTLGHLIGCLHDEEDREADYEQRLVEAHDAGKFGQVGGEPFTGSTDARDRLTAALTARKAG